MNSSAASASFLLPMNYPNRLQIRQNVINRKYRVEFDFSSFFDQFPIVHTNYFVVKINKKLFKLKKMPMGARFAPGVAQTITNFLIFLVKEKVKGDLV
jgi:hypothetical protein